MTTRLGSRAVPAKTEANDIFPAIYKGTCQTISFTGSSQASNATGAFVTIVRVFATKDCFLNFGSAPTAASTDMFLPAGIIEYFGMIPGEKIAAIRSSDNGTLYITEGTI